MFTCYVARLENNSEGKVNKMVIFHSPLFVFCLEYQKISSTSQPSLKLEADSTGGDNEWAITVARE